ncbi:MAG: hypothetical protein FJ290_06175 [Planctomycetes bacterium]|nr:hypothetical protein [Planctomycetota bacterium]
MKPRVLVKDEKYCGRYVALRSFDDNTVVGSGKTPLATVSEARAAGVREPVLMFVPRESLPWVLGPLKTRRHVPPGNRAMPDGAVVAS